MLRWEACVAQLVVRAGGVAASHGRGYGAWGQEPARGRRWPVTWLRATRGEQLPVARQVADGAHRVHGVMDLARGRRQPMMRLRVGRRAIANYLPATSV